MPSGVRIPHYPPTINFVMTTCNNKNMLKSDDDEKNWNRQYSNNDLSPCHGDQRINKLGELEEFKQNYWQIIDNKK